MSDVNATPVPTSGEIPEWTLPDRLAKARRHAGLSQEALAQELQVSRKTVLRYEHGEDLPRRMTVLAWAYVCKVNTQWLETGLGSAVIPDESDTGPVSTHDDRQLAFPFRRAA